MIRVVVAYCSNTNACSRASTTSYRHGSSTPVVRISSHSIHNSSSCSRRSHRHVGNIATNWKSRTDRFFVGRKSLIPIQQPFPTQTPTQLFFSTTNHTNFFTNPPNRNHIIGGITFIFVSGFMTARIVHNYLLTNSNTSPTNTKGYRDQSKVKIRFPKSRTIAAQNKLQQLRDPSTTADLLRTSSPQHTTNKLSLLYYEVDKQELETFLQEQRKIIVKKQNENLLFLKKRFHEDLQTLFPSQECVQTFSAWYFSYPTTYQLLSLAMKSATNHTLTFRSSHNKEKLMDRISKDLQDYIGTKYEAMVLKPTITDPKIYRMFLANLQLAHEMFLSSIIDELEESMSTFLLEQTKPYYGTPPQQTNHNTTNQEEEDDDDRIIFDIDYTTQLQKINHIPTIYEKNPEFSLAIIGTTATLGKLVGGSGATKALFGKLISPFVTKAMAAVAGGTTSAASAATAAAATGAVTAGPAGAVVGAVAGAAMGLGFDMTVNAGVALMNKSSFEEEVYNSLQETVLEWEERLLPEIEKVQKEWFRHAEEVVVAVLHSSSEKGDNHPKDKES